MNRIQRSALVPYSTQQMFDLINDIPSYPEFMRGCVGSEVLSHGEDWVIARLDLAKAGIKQSFVTRNTFVRPASIALVLEQGPFSALSGEWTFESLGGAGCKVSFWLEFEFANRLFNIAASRLFESVASNQVDSVCERAKHVYA